LFAAAMSMACQITIRAMKEGVTPQDVVDKYNTIIKDSFADMGISFDNLFTYVKPGTS